MSETCPRAGRWIGGCKFEARYNKIPPEKTIMPFTGTAQFEMTNQIEARTKRIYVCDVCTRCGKTADRNVK